MFKFFHAKKYLSDPNPFILFWIIGFFGLIFCIVVPPFQAPDEPSHFLRAYQISQGQWRSEKQGKSTGGVLPEVLEIEALKLRHIPFVLDERTSLNELQEWWRTSKPLQSVYGEPQVFLEFSNMARLSPVSYLPQALALKVAELLNLKILSAYYFARLFTFAVSLVFIFVACVILRREFIWNTLILYALPMSLFLVCSTSADGFLISTAHLLFALLVSRSYRNFFGFLLTLTVCCLLALNKFTYLLLALLPAGFLLFEKKQSRIKMGVLAFTPLLFVLLWGILTRNTVSELRQDQNMSFMLQAQRIWDDPWAFLVMCGSELVRMSTFLYDTTIGRMGWLDVYLPRWLLSGWGVVLLGFCLTQSKDGLDPSKAIKLHERFLLLGAVLFSVFLLCFLTFLTWIPVGEFSLEGLQGRYFIPLLPAVFCMSAFIRLPKIALSIQRLLTIVWVFVSMNISVICIIKRYYL